MNNTDGLGDTITGNNYILIKEHFKFLFKQSYLKF